MSEQVTKLSKEELKAVCDCIYAKQKKEFDDELVSKQNLEAETNNVDDEFNSVLKAIESDSTGVLTFFSKDIYNFKSRSKEFLINKRKKEGKYLEVKMTLPQPDRQKIQNEVVLHFLNGETLASLKDKFNF